LQPRDAIPIVFSTGIDPVIDGLVASLNRPGGNATGVCCADRIASGERLAAASWLPFIS
jgi:ABC-type uncharacterized transport system substrate-binding protein